MHYILNYILWFKWMQPKNWFTFRKYKAKRTLLVQLILFQQVCKMKIPRFVLSVEAALF